MFHDVDLAAARPPDVADVRAEHPERRPDALTARQLDPCLETAVRAFELACRVDARGRVVASAVGLAARDDAQATLAIERRVLDAIGVELELRVAPTIAADVVAPLRRIRARVLAAVEL